MANNNKELKSDREKKIVERLSVFCEKANTGTRKTWLSRIQQSDDFSMGDQLTEDQINSLKASGMPYFIVDKITPQVRLMKYFLTANNPRWTAVGADGSDVDHAHIFSTMTEYLWYISSGRLEYAKIINNCLRRSLGYFHLYEDPDLDQGMGEIVFESIDPKNVKVDPESTDMLFRDSSMLIIEYSMPRYQLINKLPEYKDKIKKAQGENIFAAYSARKIDESNTIQKEDYENPIDPITGEESDMLPYRRAYRKIRVPYVKVFIKQPPDPKVVKEIENIVNMRMKELIAETQVRIRETEKQLKTALENGEIIQERYELEIQKAKQEAEITVESAIRDIKSKLIDERSNVIVKTLPEKEYNTLSKSDEIKDYIVYTKEYNETRIKMECAVGDQFLYERTLNITEYPLIPLPFEHTGTPYPMDAIRPMIGIQQEINKAHQILIHNANVGSNPIWKAPKGMIDDRKSFEKYASSPGALIEYNNFGDGVEPKREMPLPLNNAFYSIFLQDIQDLEYSSMVNSAAMGDPSKQPEPYHGMLVNDEFRTRQIKAWINIVLNPVFDQVGKVYQQMSQNFYSAHKIFRIVQPNAYGDIDVKQAEINQPIYNDFTDQIGKFNDYSVMRFDVRVVPGSTMPVNRWALADQYERWYEKGFMTKRAVIAELDINNKSQLLKEMDEIAQRDKIIADLQEQLKQKQGDIETLSRQVIQKDIKVKVSEMESEITKDKLRTQKDLEVGREKITLAVNDTINKINESVSGKETNIKK